MEESKSKLDYVLPDYGKIKFEYRDSQNELSMSKHSRRQLYKNLGFYYLMAIVLVMIAWFIGSFISITKQSGFFQAILFHIPSLLFCAVAGLIIVLSAFGLWGKFMKFAAGQRGKRVAKISRGEKINEDDIAEMSDNAIRVYEQYLVIVNSGKESAYYLDSVFSVDLQSAGDYFFAKFKFADGDYIFARAFIPNQKRLLVQLKKIFDDKLNIIKDKHADDSKSSLRDKVLGDKSVGEFLGILSMCLIAIAVGALVIFLHYRVAPQIPVFLGLFFILVALIGICGLFSAIPEVKDIIVPLLFGITMIFCPTGMFMAVYEAQGVKLAIKDFYLVMTPFSAGAFFFAALGIFILGYGIKSAIEYIKYGGKDK